MASTGTWIWAAALWSCPKSGRRRPRREQESTGSWRLPPVMVKRPSPYHSERRRATENRVHMYGKRESQIAALELLNQVLFRSCKLERPLRGGRCLFAKGGVVC